MPFDLSKLCRGADLETIRKDLEKARQELDAEQRPHTAAPDIEQRLGLNPGDFDEAIDQERQQLEAVAREKAIGLTSENVTKRLGLCADEMEAAIIEAGNRQKTAPTVTWTTPATRQRVAPQSTPAVEAPAKPVLPSSPTVLYAVGLVGEPVLAVVQAARYTYRSLRVSVPAYFSGLGHLLTINHGFWSGYRNGKQEVTK